jgi:hypothetical protein
MALRLIGKPFDRPTNAYEKSRQKVSFDLFMEHAKSDLDLPIPKPKIRSKL